MKAKCNLCGKWITLVHRTKTHPLGRFRHHTVANGRTCYGTPLPNTVKPTV